MSTDTNTNTNRPQSNNPGQQGGHRPSGQGGGQRQHSDRSDRPHHGNRPGGGGNRPGGGDRGDRGDRGGDRGPRPNMGGQKRPKFYYRRKVCKICQMIGNGEEVNIDYKNIDLLRKFVTEKGKIIPRRLSGTCAKHQRIVTREIKKARTIAFLPFTEI